MKEFFNLLKDNAGFAAIVSMFVTLVTTGTFGLIRENMQRKQRFFEHHFPERIKAHNDLLGEFSGLLRELAVMLSLPPSERPRPFARLVGKFDRAFYKNRIWLDTNVREMLDNIFMLISAAGYLPKENCLPDTIPDYEIKEMLKNLAKQHAILLKVLEATSGVHTLNRLARRYIRPPITKRLTGFFRREKNREALERFMNTE